MVGGVGEAGDDFVAGFHVADPDICIAFGTNSVLDPQILGALELFVRFCGCERIVDGLTGGTQVLNELQGDGPETLILNQNEDIHWGIEFWQEPAGLEQFKQNDVAHAEAECRKIDFAAADKFDEIIVPAASGDRAELALAVKGLKHNSGVISQAADDLIVDFDEIAQTACSEILQNALKFSGGFTRLDEFIDLRQRRTEGNEFGLTFLGRSALKLVN